MKQEDFFSSRWMLIISTLGIAVGTGNIWRFSRVVAQNEGGTFLIPWVIFLFLWSLPLIISEFALGKSTRKGPIHAIAETAGKNYAWMGAFIVFVATAIMFYYSVVTGWCLRYFSTAMTGELFSVNDHLDFWNQFSNGYQPAVFHLLVILLCGAIVYHGISKGIERVSRYLVPSLLIILVILFIRAVTLPGALDGLNYFFTPNFAKLADYRIWLNALTQNAWDTGAGWGLIMVYAIYMRQKEDIALNAALIGFGNNSISLLAGMMIFSTVFSLSSADAMVEIAKSGPANTGLTFIYLPQLFEKITGSSSVNILLASLFFLALFFAALTSLISMVELATRTFIDAGINRRRAIIIVVALGALLGIPSAFSSSFLINQDWVWGVALMLSGAFIAFAVIKHGAARFRETVINHEGSDIKIGRWYDILITWVVPVQAVALILWWLISSVTWDAEWWNPFHVENAGTVLFQWGLVLAVLISVNKLLTRSAKGNIS
ncbi:MAG: Na+-dependent transporter [Ignavibacteriales bacterium]